MGAHDRVAPDHATRDIVAGLVARARAAQRVFERYDQAQVDEVVTAAGWAIVEPARNRALAERAVADTGLGNVADKIAKNRRKTIGLLRDLAAAKSVGIIDEDPARGLVEIARPVGVVAAITPSTNPAATPANNILNALKGRNAIVLAPSPKGRSTLDLLLRFVHAELARVGAPRDLVQALPALPDRALTFELMRAADLVVARRCSHGRASGTLRRLTRVSQGEHLGIRQVLRIPEIRAAMLGTFVIMLGFGILAPVLPNYARSFGVGYDAVGLLISAFSFARLVSDPFVGRFIDRYGERAMSTAGAVWVGLSSIAAGLAPTFPLLVLFRALGGVGSSMFFAALLSFLLRSIPAERTGRVMGVYYAAFNIGFIAGGPLGGVLAGWFGLASPLFVYAGACLIAAVAFWRTLRDPERHESEVRRGGLRRLPWNRPFITVLIVNGAYLWIIGAVFQTLVPLFGTSSGVGLSIEGVGFALGVATATELVALYPAGRASDRRGRRAVLIPALAGLALVTAALGQTTTPLAFIVALGALGVASGYSGVPPAPMLSDVAPEELKGTAVGVFRFVGDLGFVLGPLIAGWSAGAFGFKVSFAVTALPALVAVAFVVSIRETMQHGGTSQVEV